MKTERIIKLIKNYQEQCSNLFNSAIRFQRTHDDLCEFYMTNVLREDTFKRLPRWAQCEVRGYWEALYQQIWQHVEFSYVVPDGSRQLITSDAYRAVSPQEIHDQHSTTGCHIWRDAPHKLFTEPIKCG